MEALYAILNKQTYYFETFSDDRLDLLPMFSSGVTRCSSGGAFDKKLNPNIKYGQGVVLRGKFMRDRFVMEARNAGIQIQAKRYKVMFSIAKKPLGRVCDTGTFCRWACGTYTKFHYTVKPYMKQSNEFIVHDSCSWWSYSEILVSNLTLEDVAKLKEVDKNLYINYTATDPLDIEVVSGDYTKEYYICHWSGKLKAYRRYMRSGEYFEEEVEEKDDWYDL
jgi:hypothetical protein